MNGLRVWLDEEELTPGRPWQDELEVVIKTARTAAVLIGKNGLGPWEKPEMRACLGEFVNRKLPVIPVLLPDAPTNLELPIFLQSFTWVDLRGGQIDEGVKKLIWGITGEKNDNITINDLNLPLKTSRTSTFKRLLTPKNWFRK